GASHLAAALLLGPFTPGATIDLNARPPDVLIQAGGAYLVNGLFIADVNGDRVADVIVKRGHLDPRLSTGVTTVDVAFGSPDWQSGTEISWATRPPDASINAGIGTAIVQVGDVNGDGTADILAGFPWYGGEPAPPAWFPGSVHIFLGSASLRGTIDDVDVVIAGLPMPRLFRPIDRNTLGDHLGEAMAVGDVNGDGHADILIGAPGETSNDNGIVIGLSRAHVIIGSPELRRGTRIETFGAQQDATISFSPKANDFGSRVETADFNGDGIRDILVSNNHSAYVYFGGPLRAPEVSAAKYKPKTGELTVFGNDLNGAARAEINGVLIDVPAVFDADRGALILHGTPAELNLRDGKNQIALTRKGARSNAVKIKVKG
ncbi:MAG TPA: hypothetical protein VJZ91_06520, partial [Blastocatellia bacterium]|nr:hypothetical protein [Blastocatellia bacterium]